MSEILTVFFSMLAGGGVFWCVLELRELRLRRRFLHDEAAERAAEEGLRQLSTTYINAELAKGNDIPRRPE